MSQSGQERACRGRKSRRANTRQRIRNLPLSLTAVVEPGLNGVGLQDSIVTCAMSSSRTTVIVSAQWRLNRGETILSGTAVLPESPLDFLAFMKEQLWCRYFLHTSTQGVTRQRIFSPFGLPYVCFNTEYFQANDLGRKICF